MDKLTMAFSQLLEAEWVAGLETMWHRQQPNASEFNRKI